MKKFILFILLLISSFFLISCDKQTEDEPKEDQTFTIIFNANNGDQLYETVEKLNSIVNLPETPIRDHYDFMGWYDEEDTKFSGSFTVTKGMTLTAKWEKHTYVVKFFDDNNVLIKTQRGTYGEEIQFPTNPTKASDNTTVYTFSNWDNASTTIIGDLDFKAVFTSAVRKYRITFEDADGNLIEDYSLEYGATVNVPANPTKESDENYDYTFIGWSPAVTNVSDDVAYIPEFEATAKGKPTKTSLEGLTLSILGDSISTFYDASSTVNSYYHETGRYYYPTYCASVKKVEQTWWHQLYTATGMTLGINNSWSGSTAYGSSESCGMNDARLNTLDENGNPDIVIVYLGTNDSASIYEDTYTLEHYRSALETIVNKIQTDYNADIFFVELCGKHGYKEGKYLPRAYLFNEVIEDVAEEYGCGLIPIQQYVDKDNDDIYFNDNLHFNLKGTTLLAKVCEKYIKEFYGIEFTETIEVEYPEKLPEGVVAYASATANKDFWKNNNYVTNVYLSKKGDESIPQFSYKIYMKKDTTDNKYYVTAIDDGNKVIDDYEYVYYISSSHTSYSELKGQVKNVAVGNLVEFDDTLSSFPVAITFKESNKTPEPPVTPPEPDEPDEPTTDTPMYKDGVLHIGKYNGGVWTDYDKAIIAYSFAGLTDKSSLYSNFYAFSLTKDTESDNYKVTYKKNVGEAMTFDSCDYFVFIYSTLDAKEFYNNIAVNDLVSITGAITAGNANIQKTN